LDVVDYVYPERLRALALSLPAAPGVYVFHGPSGGLPLYIGKSVNIRSRVLAHLRTPEEASLLRQTQHISCQRTVGEIGALLLESALIKQQQPLHNHKLRRTRQLCAWQITPDQPPRLVAAQHLDFAADHGLAPLFGLFPSRRAAHEWLRALAQAEGLCLAVLGLERPVAGRPCFRFQIQQCRGACCGRETPAEHAQRLRAAATTLQLRAWPRSAALALIERDIHDQAIHVIRNWCHLGTVASLPEARTLTRVTPHFDADAYKVLVRPVLTALAAPSPVQALWLDEAPGGG
jgi:excinuclease Cho